jgi:flagellar M-ring protein FliF
VDLKVFLSQITALIQSLSLRQKIVASVSVAVVVGFLSFLVFFKGSNSALNDGYSVLFDNTSASDSALIIQQLDKDNIPYKVVNEGTIAVPSSVVYKERIAISAQGIPKNSKVGFEIFDKSQFGSTDFEQRIKYLRALEGELSRTIEDLNPISNASVHIAIPKESVFAEQKLPASASVVVDVKKGLNLTNKQIKGIKNLISSSVTNLKTTDVKIVNQDGIPLGEEEDFSSDLIKNQIKYKKDFETNLEDKIINVLTPIAGGSDKVVAKVTIDFDFKQQESTSEVYDPNSVPRSEQSVEEKKEGAPTKDVGGVPGAVSNIGPVQGLKSQQNGEKYQKSSTTTNYEISKKTINTKGEFATIKKISAAVVVDGNYQFAKGKDGKVTNDLKYTPLTKQQMSSITNLVKQTVGFEQKRGDEITVSNLEFKPLAKDGTKPMTQNLIDKVQYYLGPIYPLFKFLLVAIILFVFYKKVIVPFSQRMLEQQVEDLDDIENKDILDEDDNAEDTLEKFRKARKKVEEQLGIGDDFNEDSLKYDVLLEKLKTLSEQKSEEVSGLLEGMIRNASDFDVSTSSKDN